MFEHLRKKSQIICYALVMLALVLWIASVIQARCTLSSGMSELGLFGIMPLSFFIAFSFLLLSFFINLLVNSKRNLILLIIQTIFLILFINLTPIIIEGTARFTSSYLNYRTVSYISQTGQINSDAFWVLNWPSFSIFMSIFSQITSISSETILMFYTTVYNILLLIPLYAFFRFTIKDSKMLWSAIWFVFLGNWICQDYFSMQSLGFVIIILSLFLLFKTMDANTRPRQWPIVFLLLFFFVVSSHLLSSLAILSVFLIFYLTNSLKKPVFFIGLVVLTTAWAVFDAGSYLSGHLASNLQQVLDLSQIFQRNLSNRLAVGSGSHVIIGDIRVLYTATIIGFAVLGIILSWKDKKNGRIEKNLILVLAGFLLLILAFAYGGELYMRIYMFSLIPLAYFATKLIMQHRRVFYGVILFFVVLAPSFLMIAHYGNEQIDYTPVSELTGVHFLYSTTTNGYVIGGFQQADFRDSEYRSNYTLIGLLNLYKGNVSFSRWILPTSIVNTNGYLCISYDTAVYFSSFLGDAQYVSELQKNVTSSPIYDLIYSNPSLETLYYIK